MITQADILARNEDMYTQLSSNNIGNENQSEDFNDTASTQNQPPKPTNFGGMNFPDLNAFNLTENSPIRPSKYFATDSAINTSKGLRKIIIGGVTFSLIVTFALMIQIIVGGPQIPNRVGIVTQEKVCSEIGADMVKQGGNSIDAFIASSLCLSVVNPFSSGLGAGGYLLVRDHKHEKDLALNCFFRSSADLDLKNYEEKPGIGKKSVAVPGELKCLQIVYHKYARFYWKTLAAPAIKLARDGFKVSKLLAQHLKELDVENEVKNNEIMSKIFLDSNGQLVTEGAIIKNEELAKTLELLSKKESIFYTNGEIGSDIVNELKEDGRQQITLEDLAFYSVEENFLTTVSYNDFILMTTSYPSAGPSLKFIIDLMSSFSFSINDFKTPELYSRLLKASELGYFLSSYTSDPQYSNQLDKIYDEKLTLAKSYLRGENGSSIPFKNKNIILKDDLSVNYISVNDHNDLMVSYVGTLGSSWGSRIISKRGFFLNNGLNLFSYDFEQSPDYSNSVNKNKQPRGLMAPILTYNKKNPCIRRFAISYDHHGMTLDDFGYSELTQVVLKILTDFSLYETCLDDKRLQYAPNPNISSVCFEEGFDPKIQDKIVSEDGYKKKSNCMYHSINLVMKKDHIVYGKEDNQRSESSLVLQN